MAIAYIGLGSNLEQPLKQVKQALLNLDLLPASYLLAYSSCYQSQPMQLAEDQEPQAPYINAVAKLYTAYKPLDLLDKLQNIENIQGRKREKRWGARTIDLDLLLYDHTIMQTERLTLPHYGIKQRDFVLKPLAEINPNLVLPDGSHIQDLIAQCQDFAVRRL
ncbi:MAG: 2-amino-4-hydroxy-6-hydroxymethyldihydropteridine diphosphokinase [Kangiellaceae bacterium]|nr:2-amino-4-hydroxy-6-hydroxymethyldihydropteridine diphosphokinase [Kangiellaceae bacterium]